MLAVLLEFGDERRKVAVPGDDDERVDVLLGIGQVHGVDAQANVGRIFAGLRAARNLDQLDGRFVQRGRVFLEAVPVCAAISETPTRDPAVTIGRARIVATVTSGNLLPPGSNIFVSAQDSDPVDQFGYMQAPFSDCISGADVGAGEPVLRGNVLVRDHNGIAK